MKIAIVTEFFFPRIGGQEIRFLELASNLVRRGHSVTVYTIAFEEGLPESERINGVNVLRVHYAPNYFVASRRPMHRSIKDIFLFTLKLLMRARELREFDNVIFNIHPLAPSFILAPFVRKKAVLDWCDIRLSLPWRLIGYVFSKEFKRFFAISSTLKQQLIHLYGIDERRIAVIMSGIHSASFAWEKSFAERSHLLYLGRFCDYKQPLVLAQLYKSKSEINSVLPLIFAGCGELLDDLKRECANEPRITILDNISEDKKRELLSKARLLIMPSKREGFPRVIAEAAASGTPSVAMDFPENGTASVIREFGLGWVSSSDIEDYSSTIFEGLSVQKEWEDCSQRARSNAVAHFDWDEIVNQLINFLGLPL